MNQKRLITAALSVLMAAAAHAQTVDYTNGNPGDWTDNATSALVPVTTSATGGPGGGGFTTITNVPDEYLPGVGAGPYTLFGTGITAPVPIFQSVAVYINANMAAPTPAYDGSFWIDMAPNNPDPNNFGAEHNFRLTADGSDVSISVDGQSSPIADITTSGWYDFQTTYSSGGSPTSLVVSDMNVYSMDPSGNLAALLGTTTVLANSPGDGPLESQDLTGSGYLWFTVWTDGTNGNTLDVADVETGALPTPDGANTACLLGFAMVGLGVYYRSDRRSRSGPGGTS